MAQHPISPIVAQLPFISTTTAPFAGWFGGGDGSFVSSGGGGGGGGGSSSSTYATLFPNRPTPASQDYLVGGSWTTIMDIRWGRQGLNGGEDGFGTYADIPTDASTANGSFMKNFSTGTWGKQFSLVSDSAITGNLGGTVFESFNPAGFPAGSAPTRVFGNSTCTGPAWGFSYSSTSGPIRSVYVGFWVKYPSAFSLGGGAGYKGISLQQSPSYGINHFPGEWADNPGNAGDSFVGMATLGQAPFWIMRPPPSLQTKTMADDTWYCVETVWTVDSNDPYGSNGTVVMYRNGSAVSTRNQKSFLSSGGSAFMNSWGIQFFNGGGGVPLTSGQSFRVGPILIMGAS